MNEVIFEDLRFEVEQKCRKQQRQIHQQCYNEHKKTLLGAPLYASCYNNKIKQLAQYEQKAKLRLLYLTQLSQKNKQTFNLTEEIGKFIKEFNLNAEDLQNL